VTVRLVPAPRGAGIVAARVPKKVLQFAGVQDVYTQTKGKSGKKEKEGGGGGGGGRGRKGGGEGLWQEE
jgi:hypothetical protein